MEVGTTKDREVKSHTKLSINKETRGWSERADVSEVDQSHLERKGKRVPIKTKKKRNDQENQMKRATGRNRKERTEFTVSREATQWLARMERDDEMKERNQWV